jgi:8-oxo-dGTP diphosphatase
MSRKDAQIDDPDIRAAGGVIVRDGDDGPEVAVIHRPKYMDWSLPKGKLEPGESWEKAALREVEEETGYRCELGRELPEVSYLDRKGRSKLVRYWRMSPVGGSFAPGTEVDELRWVDLDEARRLLHYDHDRELVGEVLDPP